MLKTAHQYATGMAVPILALSVLAACTQPDIKDETKTKGSQDLKTLSAKLNQPYLINDQGEVIGEIPPFILQKMKENLKNQAKISEASELERMYDPETGKLRDLDKLAEIQNRLDKLAADANLPALKGGNL